MSDFTAPLAMVLHKTYSPLLSKFIIICITIYPMHVSNRSSQGNEMYTVVFHLVSTCSMGMKGHSLDPISCVVDNKSSIIHIAMHSLAPF